MGGDRKNSSSLLLLSFSSFFPSFFFSLSDRKPKTTVIYNRDLPAPPPSFSSSSCKLGDEERAFAFSLLFAGLGSFSAGAK